MNVTEALEAFGPTRVRRGLQVYGRPRSNVCDCFVTNAYHGSYEIGAWLEARATFPEACMVLSDAYEGEPATFRAGVLDWLAKQDAIEAVTCPPLVSVG